METPTGRIVWFDYLTSEPDKAQVFFGSLFGWQIQQMTTATDSYTMMVGGGRAIGGYRKPLPGTPIYRYSEPYSRWLPHFQIANGHESAVKAKSLGAKMLREPAPFADAGKLAISTDPNGQAFAMWQPNKVDADPGWAGPPNTFCWAELYTLNTTSSVSFFRTIGGFTETKSQMPDGTYHLLERDGQPRAGVRMPMSGVQPGWFAWIRVPDIMATVAKAQKLEATVVMPPANSAMALLVDPWGCTFGLAQQ